MCYCEYPEYREYFAGRSVHLLPTLRSATRGTRPCQHTAYNTPRGQMRLGPGEMWSRSRADVVRVPGGCGHGPGRVWGALAHGADGVGLRLDVHLLVALALVELRRLVLLRKLAEVCSDLSSEPRASSRQAGSGQRAAGGSGSRRQRQQAAGSGSSFSSSFSSSFRSSFSSSSSQSLTPARSRWRRGRAEPRVGASRIATWSMQSAMNMWR